MSEENVTVRLAGEEQIVRHQEPLVWISALVMAPSSRILDSAAVIPTGLATTAQSVMSALTYCWSFIKLCEMLRSAKKKKVLQMYSSEAHIEHDWKEKFHSSTI